MKNVKSSIIEVVRTDSLITRLNGSVTIYFSLNIREPKLIDHMISTDYIWFGLAELLRLLEVENIVFHTMLTLSPLGYLKPRIRWGGSI